MALCYLRDKALKSLPETSQQFENRKADHLRLALDPSVLVGGDNHFSRIHLVHEALPNLNFSEIDLSTELLGQKFNSPFFVSSMTAGNLGGLSINQTLAVAAQTAGWLMGVGSQRKELTNPEAHQEWKALRKVAPRAKLVGNLGISQLIQVNVGEVQRLVDHLEAVAMFIHLNPLQECLQPEGTPQFRGGLEAIENLVRHLSVPVIVKEVGCGMSQTTIKRLAGVGVAAIDVSGYGGTHWGRIEGLRAKNIAGQQIAETFSHWGTSTVESLMSAIEADVACEVWASGGVRNGLDAAKLLAVGGQAVGIAQPLLEAALQSPDVLLTRMQMLEHELRIAMFCTGVSRVTELSAKRVWVWK